MLQSGAVSHDWKSETLEAKARWFQSLPIEERMRIFDEFTEMILEINPSIAHGRLHVASKRVVGREVDLEDVRLLEQPS